MNSEILVHKHRLVHPMIVARRTTLVATITRTKPSELERAIAVLHRSVAQQYTVALPPLTVTLPA
jgi:hypothetical protein